MIPNLLSFSRIILSVYLFVLIQKQSFYQACFVIILAAITDFLDGFLARSWNEITPFGTWLDPAADKIFLSVLFVALWKQSLIPGHVLGIFLMRDVLLALGWVVLNLGYEIFILTPSMISKINTTLQFLYTIFVILRTFPFFSASLILMSLEQFAMWGAVLFTTASGISYLSQFVQIIYYTQRK